MQRRSRQAVVWDFNGTLVDDVSAAVHAINAVLRRRHLPALSIDRYRDVFGFPLEGYYRAIGIDLSADTLCGLADEFHEAYLPILASCRPSPGVFGVLDLLRELSVPQVVLSAMEESSLRQAVDRLGMATYFDAVYGLDHRLADSKLDRGRALLERMPQGLDTILLIGDTRHDAYVAEELGMEALLVAEGHQSASRLRDTGRPVHSTFDELETTLREITGREATRR